jgi:cell wall-associated NlpC family hydrolase
MPITSEQVVREARSWVGVRYRNYGRSRDGVDCIGLVLKVGHALGSLTYDTTAYARRPDPVQLLGEADRYLLPLPAAKIAPGHVVALRFEGEPQHFGIIGDYRPDGFSLIHALALSRRVVEHRLDDLWRGRIVRAYALPGVADWHS